MHDVINYLSMVIGIVGVIVIFYGACNAVVQLIKEESNKTTEIKSFHKRNRIRSNLSGYLLTGLEFMIGADIIGTVSKPTIQELTILASMVVIRTVISYFLNKESKEFNE